MFKRHVGWLLVILLPLLVTGWLGVRTLTAEYQTLALQRQQWERQQFTTLDAQLLAGLNQWVDGLQLLTKTLKADLPSIRYQLLTHPAVDGVLLLDGGGEQVYPPDVNNALFQEQELLRGVSAARIWADRPVGDGVGRKWYAQLSSRSFRLVCDYFPDKSVQCLRLKEPQFMEQVRQLTSQWITHQAVNPSLQVMDDAGRMVLQAGDMKAGMWFSVPLSLPLAGWSVHYAVMESQAMRLPLLPLISMLLPLAVVLMAAVAWLYYQQWSRERETTRKAHFLNQVAHELRTPLTSIRLYAELAEMRESGDAKLRQHLQVIMSECGRMSELADHYLEYQRSTTQQSLVMRLENIPALLQACVSQWQALPDFAQQAVTLKGEFYPLLWVSRRTIEQILFNLLSNACKHAASDQAVQISHRFHKPYWEMRVSDGGCGIPDEWREKIFEPFVRVPVGGDSAGSGLGLSICRNLAMQHGGSIRLLKTVTDGACFVVRLRCQEETT